MFEPFVFTISGCMSSVEKSFRQSNLSWDNPVDCVTSLCERYKNFEGGKTDWGAGQMRCNGCILGHLDGEK